MKICATRRDAVKLGVAGTVAVAAASSLRGVARADEGSEVDVASIAERAVLALPSDVAGLPVIAAQEFAEIAPGSGSDALEGVVCGAGGTVYVCHRFKEEVGGEEVTSSEICKVDADGGVERFAYKADASFNGIAIHQDGRFFVADMSGHIWVYSQEGGDEPQEELPLGDADTTILPNDLVFDANTGDLYFVNFNSSVVNPTGGVYRLSAESDYQELNEVVGGLVTPNGITFDLECSSLYVSETALNRILKIKVADGVAGTGFLDTRVVYQGQGANGPDSSRLDADGNFYQAFYPAGRAVVFNRDMIPVANVVPFDRDGGEGWKTSSLAISPTAAEGYLISGGERGMWLLKFPTLAVSAPLWHLV